MHQDPLLVRCCNYMYWPTSKLRISIVLNGPDPFCSYKNKKSFKHGKSVLTCPGRKVCFVLVDVWFCRPRICLFLSNFQNSLYMPVINLLLNYNELNPRNSIYHNENALSQSSIIAFPTTLLHWGNLMIWCTTAIYATERVIKWVNIRVVGDLKRIEIGSFELLLMVSQQRPVLLGQMLVSW